MIEEKIKSLSHEELEGIIKEALIQSHQFREQMDSDSGERSPEDLSEWYEHKLIQWLYVSIGRKAIKKG